MPGAAAFRSHRWQWPRWMPNPAGNPQARDRSSPEPVVHERAKVCMRAVQADAQLVDHRTGESVSVDDCQAAVAEALIAGPVTNGADGRERQRSRDQCLAVEETETAVHTVRLGNLV